jgi:hypothetical protein
MDWNAYRDGNDTGQLDANQPDANQPDAYQPDAYQPDAYWRRRVITLCAGLALLGLLAWAAFSGGWGKPAAAKKAAQASGALPTAACNGTLPAAPLPAAPRPMAPRATAPPPAPEPPAIVLSLFTSKTSYHAGQYPVFEVYAVSTASRGCTFNLSPAKLHVLVSSSGRVIWDSADCTRGQPNKRAEQASRTPPRRPGPGAA